MKTVGLPLKRDRVALIGLTAAAVWLTLAAGGAATANAATTCTWAGTPAAPTGTLTISPGLTNFPAPGPLRFRATGPLAGAGRCAGTMSFVGQLDAGSTCAMASFEGNVKGLPGVARFWGKGNLLVPSLLYDKAGNWVGVENPQIVTETNLPRFSDCNTAKGFTGGWPRMFSSVVELFGG